MAESTSPVEPIPPPRVFVHIGAPKTGTTFVQNVLWANREELARDGVLYPYETAHQHFPAMLDLRERGWGAHSPGYWRGTWQAVAHRSATWSGHTVILGNEVMGGASETQIRRLADSLQPAEVHIVFTARDLARQLVSDWQEHIKHKHTITLEDFVDELITHGRDARPPFGEMFWELHDAAYVLQRWAKVLPADRIHLVTLPQPGSDAPGLWERFCSVTGLDPQRYSLDVGRSNVSLSRPEAEFLRRLNTKVQSMHPPHYDAMVRIKLTGKALTGKGGRIVLPDGRMPWVEQRSRTMIDELSGQGYDVVGDLEELMPRPEDHADHVATENIRARRLLPVSMRVNASLLRIAASQRSRIQRYRRELGDLPPEPPRPTAAPSEPLPSTARRAVDELRSRMRRSRRRRRG